MINSFIGTPGSGKTYEAVKNIIDNLLKGRTVYTNIDGLDNPNCRELIKIHYGFGTFFLDTHLIYLTNEEAQEFWLHCKPASYIVIDECHKLFSNRDWQTVKNRDFTFWASTHRKQGYDVLLVTQDVVKIDSHVRSLIEWTHVFRKINFLGSKINRKYICHAYSGEDISGQPLKKSIRTYNPVIFQCYQSYASKDIKEMQIMQGVNVLKHPVFFAIPIVLVFTLYMFFSKSSFATGDLFGAKAVMAGVEKKEQPKPKPDKSKPGSQQASPDTPKVASAKPAEEKKETVPYQLNYIKIGRKYKIPFNGRIYSLENFPYNLRIEGIDLIASIPADELPAKKPSSEEPKVATASTL